MTATDDPMLTGPEAAKRAGLATNTWRGYVFRGIAPPPDDPDDDRPPNRRMPRWLTSTVDHFTANRIGQGKRPVGAERAARVARLLAEADASAERYRATPSVGEPFEQRSQGT